MKIHKQLLEYPNKTKEYFNVKNSDGWLGDYKKKAESINHDEPWVTLVALYAIFGDQSRLNDPTVIQSLEQLLSKSNPNWTQKIKSIRKIKVEFQPPEILSYREHLHQLAKGPKYHLYPDRNETIEKKSVKKKASFEGSTNMDVYLELECVSGNVGILIEAKYLSDISYQITYNPARDQIIRNIDCGIDMVYDRKELDDFYFFLLTPGLFRPVEFGARKKYPLDAHVPERSRLYCYKMLDYQNPGKLKAALPHRITDSRIDWDHVSKNIAWITFEEMIDLSIANDLVPDAKERIGIDAFFRERNLLK